MIAFSPYQQEKEGKNIMNTTRISFGSIIIGAAAIGMCFAADGLFLETGAQGQKVLRGEIKGATVLLLAINQATPTVTWPTAGKKAVITGSSLILNGYVAGNDAFPCTPEKVTGQPAYFRAVSGMSRSTLNTGIYCRTGDWAVICSSSANKTILYDSTSGGRNYFHFALSGSLVSIELVTDFFKVRRTMTYFKPWEYTLAAPAAGWISWAAYGTGITEQNLKSVADWQSANLKDYGLEYLAVDDGWFAGSGGMMHSVPMNVDWTIGNPGRFPSGMKSFFDYVHGKGLKAGLWFSPFGFSGNTADHPDWWVRKGANGPLMTVGSDWHGVYFADATVPDAVSNWLLRGINAQLANGMDFLKLDGCMHVREAYSGSLDYFAPKGFTWQDAFRKGYEAIRTALGNKYMIASWSRITEIAGYPSSMRVGGDKSSGWGNYQTQAREMSEWMFENNIVWVVDPDHLVLNGATEAEFRSILTAQALSGAQLMFSDDPGNYSAPKIDIMRRAVPIISGPVARGGQLFENKLDAQPVWSLEINRPFSHWMVVANTDFHPTTKVSSLDFSSLGLDPAKSYAVYEYWTKQYKGVFTGKYDCGAPGSHDVQVFAIHETGYQPFVLSTNRHITQGAVDLMNVVWDPAAKTLTGTSKVVRNDLYAVTLYVPNGLTLQSATFNNAAAAVSGNNGAAVIAYTPAQNDTVTWVARFGGQVAADPLGSRNVPAVYGFWAKADKGNIRITGNVPGDYRVAVCCASGRTVFVANGNKTADYAFSVGPSGLYIVRIDSGNWHAVRAITLSR
jgi:hypothetical protein